MKKIIALTLAIVMAVSMFAACGKKDVNTDQATEPQVDVTETVESTDAATDETTDVLSTTDTDVAETEPVVDVTEPAQVSALAQLLNDVYAKTAIDEVKMEAMDLDVADMNILTSYTGLESNEKIQAAAVLEPMIGSMAYSMVVVEVKDPADAEAVAAEMAEKINPAKWVCVEADDIAHTHVGNKAFFIMKSSDLTGSTSADIVAAFESMANADTQSK